MQIMNADRDIGIWFNLTDVLRLANEVGTLKKKRLKRRQCHWTLYNFSTYFHHR